MATRSTIDNLQVLYEDNHLIAVNKRSSDIVQGDKTGDVPLIDVVAEYIARKYNKPGKAFVEGIHRLDRPVSGVILFARTSKALDRMNKIFRDRDVQKTYWAITENPPARREGTLVNFLWKNQSKNKSHVVHEGRKDAKRAELTYKHVGSGDRYHFIEVKPVSGRHHQIRVQLSNMDAIIKGDLKYGAKRNNPDASICLHARQIEFMHPVKKEPLTIVAPPPADPLWNAFLDIAGDK